MHPQRVFVFLFLFLSLASLATARIDAPRPPSFVPSEVEEAVVDRSVFVGLYVLNLGKFDIATGGFTADFYLSMTCESRCPPFDFEFMNGRATTFEKIIDEPHEKFYRIQAQLTSPVNLKQYPFDQQLMQIIIEDKKTTIDELIYVADIDQSGIESSIAFTGWMMGNWSINVSEHTYEVYNETYSQYIFSVPVERARFNALLKTFLPVMFIVLVMLSSFVLDPDKIATRLGMVGSALVASVMFHVSLSNQLPPLGYLTFADKFMILTYFVMLLSFVFNVGLMEFNERGKKDIVEKYHRRTEYTMLILVPLLYLLLFVFFL